MNEFDSYSLERPLQLAQTQAGKTLGPPFREWIYETVIPELGSHGANDPYFAIIRFNGLGASGRTTAMTEVYQILDGVLGCNIYSSEWGRYRNLARRLGLPTPQSGSGSKEQFYAVGALQSYYEMLAQRYLQPAVVLSEANPQHGFISATGEIVGIPRGDLLRIRQYALAARNYAFQPPKSNRLMTPLHDFQLTLVADPKDRNQFLKKREKTRQVLSNLIKVHGIGILEDPQFNLDLSRITAQTVGVVDDRTPREIIDSLENDLKDDKSVTHDRTQGLTVYQWAAHEVKDPNAMETALSPLFMRRQSEDATQLLVDYNRWWFRSSVHLLPDIRNFNEYAYPYTHYQRRGDGTYELVGTPDVGDTPKLHSFEQYVVNHCRVIKVNPLKDGPVVQLRRKLDQSDLILALQRAGLRNPALSQELTGTYDYVMKRVPILMANSRPS